MLEGWVDGGRHLIEMGIEVEMGMEEWKVRYWYGIYGWIVVCAWHYGIVRFYICRVCIGECA